MKVYGQITISRKLKFGTCSNGMYQALFLYPSLTEPGYEAKNNNIVICALNPGTKFSHAKSSATTPTKSQAMLSRQMRIQNWSTIASNMQTFHCSVCFTTMKSLHDVPGAHHISNNGMGEVTCNHSMAGKFHG